MTRIEARVTYGQRLRLGRLSGVLAGGLRRLAAAYVAAGGCAQSTAGAGVGRDGRAVSCPSLSDSLG